MNFFKATGFKAAGAAAVCFALGVAAPAGATPITPSPAGGVSGTVTVSPGTTYSTLTYTFILPTEALTGTSGYAYALSLPLFDTVNGKYTLTGVTEALAATATGSVTITNTDTTAQNFSNAGAQTGATFTGPDGTKLTLFPIEATQASGAVDAPNCIVFSGATYCQVGTGIATYTGLKGNASTGPKSVTNLSPWQGSGSASKNVQVVLSPASSMGTALPGVFFGGSISTGGTLTIVYDYIISPVHIPVPGFIGLSTLGVGLVGLGLVRRRKA